MRRERGPALPVALLLAAAALLWASSRMTWVRVQAVSDKAPAREFALGGGDWFGALTPCALALLAAVAAVLVTRGWARRIVGVVAAVIGGVTAAAPLALLLAKAAPPGRARPLIPAQYEIKVQLTQHVSLTVAVLGAIAAFAAGVLLARHPGQRGGPSKYQRASGAQAAAVSAATTSAEPVSERVLWDALDAGTDPTDTGERRK